MNILVRELWAVFVLVIISDGIAAFFASRACWRLRRRAQLAWPLTIFMFTIALVDLNEATNIAANGIRNPEGVATYQALIGRMVRSAATWYLALRLMNGYSSQHKEKTDETTSHEADTGGAGPVSG